MSEHIFFFSAFILSACAGLAALLRIQGELTKLKIFAATLNSGLAGLTIALVWYLQYRDNIYTLLGICIIAGMGGMSVIDLLLDLFRKSGISISFKKEKKDEPT